MLSAYLHFGQISPNGMLNDLNKLKRRKPTLQKAIHTFIGEMLWREFSYYVLYHYDASHGERSEGEYSEIGADFYRA